MYNSKHTVEVNSTQEYREVIEAAETLGLELDKITASRGGWETKEDYAIHPRGSVNIEKMGYEYVHFAFEEGTAKAKFGWDSVREQRAELTLYFK